MAVWVIKQEKGLKWLEKTFINFHFLSANMKIGTFIKIGSFPEEFWQGEFDFVRSLKKLGVAHLEISLQYPYTGPLTLKQEQIEKIKSLADFEIILHPILSYDKAPEDLNGKKFDLASLDENIKKFSIEEMTRVYDIAKKLNAKLITVHGGYCDSKGDYKKNLSALRKTLIELSGKFPDVLLCIENLPFTGHFGMPIKEIPYYPEDLIFLTKGIANAGVTLDVGHANTVMNPVDFYKKLVAGTRVYNMHVHDNKGDKDDHLPLGKGNIDFEKLIQYLKETNYEGYFTVELDINWGHAKMPSQEERKSAIEFLDNLGRRT